MINYSIYKPCLEIVSMYSSKRNVIVILLYIAVFVLSTHQCSAQIFIQHDTQKSGLVSNVQNAQINWANEFFLASGEGVLPGAAEEPDRTKAYNKAKGYGKIKAITNLLMAIEGTTVSFKAVAKDYISKDDQLRQDIEGYVGNAEIVGERQRSDANETAVIVTIKAPMYDSKGVGSAILKSRFQHHSYPINPSSLVIEKQAEARSTTISPNSHGPYTSLIVDCTGLRIDPAMSPKIRRADGSEFWGSATKYDFLQNHGVVSYAQTVDEAKQRSRAGSNPLIVRAIGRSGNRFMCDPILLDTDIDIITTENQASHFLDKFDVFFVIDSI